MVAVGRGSSKPRVLARGFETPLGLTWVGSTLFVSAQGYVSRLGVRGRQVVSRRKIVTRLPFDRHQQDTIVLGPDGRLYLGSGSTCDVCKEKDARSGAILSFRQDGSDLRVVARGLRNPFGLVFDGETLYVSDNARDDLGDDEPAETIVRIKQGADYGWPRCWASWRLRQAAGLVPRRHAARRLPRAALVGEHARTLGGDADRRRVGPVPERALGPQARAGERPHRPLLDPRRRLRAPARARGRATRGRPARRRLGPRRDLPDQEALSAAGERARQLLLIRRAAQEPGLARGST